MLIVEKLLCCPDRFLEVTPVCLRVGEFKQDGALLWTCLESLPELQHRLFKLAFLHRPARFLAQACASRLVAGGGVRFLGRGERR